MSDVEKEVFEGAEESTTHSEQEVMDEAAKQLGFGEGEKQPEEGSQEVLPENAPVQEADNAGGEQVAEEEIAVPPKEDSTFEELIQTRYQKALDRLKKVDPQYDVWKRELRGKTDTSLSDDGDDYITNMNKNELQQLVKRTVTEASTDAYRQVQGEANYHNEFKTADSVITTFMQENKIPKEEFDSAYDYAVGLGLDVEKPGGPSAIAKVVIKEFQRVGLMKHFSEKVIKAQAEAAGKVKAANLVKQPDAAPVPGTTSTNPNSWMGKEPSEMSKEEQLAAMRAVGISKASEDVFGKP